MSFSNQGLDAKLKSATVNTVVSNQNPLIQLANLIDWQEMAAIVLPDLQSTTAKGFWFLGRRLYLRVHLAAMILQVLFKFTDRQCQWQIGAAPIFQVFCGKGVVKNWRCPDHTKIENFRNRLSPESHKKICDYVLIIAQKNKMADPSILDVDSTVQEANIAYPSDATLMKKWALKCKKTLDYMMEKGKKYLPMDLAIDILKILKKSREYFFLPKNAPIEKKREIFKKYYSLVKRELNPFINFIKDLSPQALSRLPWNFQVNVREIQADVEKYFQDVKYFIRNHRIKAGKILSIKMRDVVCIIKGKEGKDKEFGRVFQLGRIGGNFLVPYTSTSLAMNDKESLPQVLSEHEEIFGKWVLESVTADKGYYSQKNVGIVMEKTGSADGIQRPAKVKDQVVGHQKEELYNRRSGVEPVIGHVKKFGLGKSKMKSDRATLASGYRSVLGFNLHQIQRKLAVEI